MRVALLNPRRQRRGGEIFSRRLADELRRRGQKPLEIYLYPPDNGDGLPVGEDEICLNGHERTGIERVAGWDPTTAHRLRSALDRAQVDVLQVSGGKTLAYAALGAGGSARRPALIYRNIGEPGTWFRSRRHRWVYSRWVFPRVTAVATVAQRFIPDLERSCPNARAVRCIPGGLDFERLTATASRIEVRASLATGEAAPVILFAGRLSREKRVDRLLRAFAGGLERRPDAILWIAGAGPLAAGLKRQALELGIAPSVTFLGERDDVADLLGACDLVALSSDTEGVPGIVQEAAGAGRPVVATRAGATDEAVIDGTTGILVAPGDETALSGALFDLLTDHHRREAMGAAGACAFGRERLSIEAAATAYEQLYREVLPTPSVGAEQ